MSMLRRPLTQLELCERDIKWLCEQITIRQIEPKEAQMRLADAGNCPEPMEITTEEIAMTSDGGITTRVTSGSRKTIVTRYDMPDPRIVRHPVTPQAPIFQDMTTPVQGAAIVPPAPNVRVTRAQARLSRVGGPNVPASATGTMPVAPIPLLHPFAPISLAEEDANSSAGTPTAFRTPMQQPLLQSEEGSSQRELRDDEGQGADESMEFNSTDDGAMTE